MEDADGCPVDHDGHPIPWDCSEEQPDDPMVDGDGGPVGDEGHPIQWENYDQLDPHFVFEASEEVEGDYGYADLFAPRTSLTE